MVGIPHKVLENREAPADPGQLALLEYSGNVPFMTDEPHFVPDMEPFLLGVVLIDEHVLVGLERSASEIMEATAHFRKRVEIQSRDRVETRQRLDSRSCR